MQTLQRGTPQEAGLDEGRLERAAALLEQQVADKTLGSAALLVGRDNTIALSRGYGHLRPDGSGAAVGPDTIFLLASITKPVTACALMLLVERGQVCLSDPVGHYLPEYRGGLRDKVRVQDILSHTSGMPDMLPENITLRRRHAPLAEFVDCALKTPLHFEPNTDFSYQSKGILLAAEIVQRVSGQALREFERQEIFAPLGMGHSALGVGDFALEDTVWCGMDLEEGEDARHWGPNSPYWRDIGAPWGGMHSCVEDLAVLLQTMLNGGTYGANSVFSPAAVQAMLRDQNGHLPAPWGLGWGLGRSIVWNCWGDLVSPATFGHTGATGTVAWADPATGLLCVILTNQMVAGGSLLRRVSNGVAASVM